MVAFEYPFATTGELLYRFVRLWMSESFPSHELAYWLTRVGYASEWLEYIEQFTAVALTGRIIAAGRSYEEKHHADWKLYTQEFRSFLNDHLTITKESLDKLLRVAIPAVDVAGGKIPLGLKREFRDWAEHNHPHCYLCGQLLDFHPNVQSDTSYTCEHIWPSSYGGDSIRENFLPACQRCNSEKKRHFATWAMTSIQSVIRGIEPTEQDLRIIDGTHRFALHYWAGQRYAIKHRKNLQKAFRKIGPWQNLRVNNRNDVAHFFNLSIHDSDVNID